MRPPDPRLRATSSDWDDAYAVDCPACDARRGEVCTWLRSGGPNYVDPARKLRPLLRPHQARVRNLIRETGRHEAL